MTRRPRSDLSERVASAAEAALEAQDYVSFLDVLLGIQWVYEGNVKPWRTGRINSLEGAIPIKTERLAEDMALFRAWTTGRGLLPSEAEYVARTAERQKLRFSRSGDPAIESFYRTHWVSPKLSEKKREHLAEKASRPPELVVISPVKRDWTCCKCGGTGNFLMMQDAGPACLNCVGLGDLEFLPTGDALLTRRAKAASKRFAVVVRFSRSRKRYERQGLLVEPEALAAAERSVEAVRNKAP